MVIASCGNHLYGTPYWVSIVIWSLSLLDPWSLRTDCLCPPPLSLSPLQNLWDFFSAVLDNNWNAGARTLVFLAAMTQVYATFVTNISSNSIPVGCDLTGLFPRYFTIVRGQVLCALLAVAVGESDSKPSTCQCTCQ